MIEFLGKNGINRIVLNFDQYIAELNGDQGFELKPNSSRGQKIVAFFED